MMMDCFHRSPDTQTFFETDERLYEDYRLRPDERVREMHRRSRAPFFVFKALLESHRIVELMELSAGAKSVWIFRRVEDMLNSHLRNWPGHRESIDEIVTDPTAGGYRAERMTPETHDLIQSLYRPGQSEEDCVALFWILRNRPFFDQSLDVHPDSLLLCYERLVAEPLTHMKRLCAHSGLPYDPRMHEHIHARSVSKNDPPEVSAAILDECHRMYARFEHVERAHIERLPSAC